jgi:hypothetical protein
MSGVDSLPVVSTMDDVEVVDEEVDTSNDLYMSEESEGSEPEPVSKTIGDDDESENGTSTQLQKASTEAVKGDASPPTKKRGRKSSSASSAATELKRKRKQPGGALLKTEKDKIEKTLASLIQKRSHRDKSARGKSSASVCGILLDNLVEFYESVNDGFDKKFGKYMV